MAGDHTNPVGLIHSLRRLGEMALAIVQNRLELAAVELGEEKHRLIDALFWLSICVFSAIMAAIVVTFSIIFLLWDRTGAWILAGFCGFYLLATVTGYLVLRHRLTNSPPPFANTLGEIKKDQACLRSQK